MPENFDELPKQLSDDLERRLDHFDASWSSDTPPVVAAYLPKSLQIDRTPPAPHWRRYVAELLSVDLEHRLRQSAADPPRIEDYFAQLPWLCDDALVLTELIQAEFMQRRQQGDDVSTDEYLQRFPRLGTSIPRCLNAARQELERERPDRQTSRELEVTEMFGVADEETLPHATGEESTPPTTGAMPRTLGDYELQHEIARGGMGIVYKAIQRSLKRPVALKVILSGGFADAEDVRRFHSEAEAAARLDHPNIVPIFEVGEQQGHPYFSMAYIDGPSLSQLVAHQPLDARRAATLMRDVAAAIQYAHTRGIIHRDLKPSNILLEADTTPRVTDFGLARQTNVESGVTERGQVLGAPPYMPPEQALGHVDKIDPRSDVYSLGATLYHLVTGRPPFTAATVLQTLAQVVQDEPLSPRRLNHNIPRDLENICLKCLSKAPEGRYQSADEFGQDLDRFLRGVPTLARPVSTTERVYRFCRRRPAVAALLATVVGSVLLALGAVSTAWVKTSQALYSSQMSESLARSAEARAIASQEKAEESEARARASEEIAIQQKDIAQRHLRVAEFNIYLNDLQRARQLWTEGQIEQIRELLATLPGKLTLWDELHGWEYDYTRGLLRQEQWRIEAAHQGDQGLIVDVVAWSPDGRRFATAGRDHLIKIWDRDHQQFDDACRGHEGAVRALRFIDGSQQLLSISEDGTVREWDERRSWRSRHLASNLTGLTVATISRSGRRWAWSDGSHLEVYELGSDEPLLRHSDPAGHYRALDFDATADRIALADAASKQILILSLDEASPAVPISIDAGECFAIAFDGDSRRIAAGGTSGWLHVWDSQTGRPLGRWSDDQGTIYGLQFGSDEDQLVSCSDDKTVRLWSISREEPSEIFRGHRDPVVAVQLQPGGDEILSGGMDGTIRVWRPEHDQIHLAEWRHKNTIMPSADGDRLRYVSEGTLKQASFDTLPVSSMDVALPWPAAERLVPVDEPAGSFVVAAADQLLHCDAGGRPLQEFSTGDQPIEVLCRSSDAERVASAEQRPSGSQVRVFDVASGALIWNWDFDARITRMQFGRDHRHLIVIDAYGSASLCNTAAADLVLTTELSGGVHALRSSPRDAILATAENDGSIRIFQADDLSRKAVLRGHVQSVNDIAFSPDGDRLASAGTDHTVRIWSPAHEAPLLTLEGHQRPVERVFWVDGGRSLVSVDDEGTAIRWRTPLTGR